MGSIFNENGVYVKRLLIYFTTLSIFMDREPLMKRTLPGEKRSKRSEY